MVLNNKSKKIVGLLKKKKIKISFAESCTGGMLSSALTSVSGSSKVFTLGLVTYSNQSKNHIGVLVCGSANGAAMAANKHKNIRAAICWSEEIASLSKTHNNANVICIPARFISKEEQKKIIDIFLSKKFEGGRHANRVNKINC